jgi:aspartate carbamoyltransferase catalytic subunit
VRGLLSVGDLDVATTEELFRLSDAFVEVSARPIPKVPALRGRTVVSVFFEDSTRTRMSFETAARRLSADVMNFAVGTSSLNKGESVRDTIETIEAMGIDAIVVRHRNAGVPHQVAEWSDAVVVNAGDGAHEHPTQALLDAFTLRRRFGRIDGLRVAIVGDVRHSRVARSNVFLLTELGARVTLVAPRTLLPASLEGWPVDVTSDLDAVVGEVDVVYLLRMQRERMGQHFVPSLREYTQRFGLTVERATRLAPDAVVMHPGPMNRGIEIAGEVAEGDHSLVVEQVRHGVAVRMAVLWWLLGSGTDRVPTVSDDGSDVPPGDVGDEEVGR